MNRFTRNLNRFFCALLISLPFILASCGSNKDSSVGSKNLFAISDSGFIPGGGSTSTTDSGVIPAPTGSTSESSGTSTSSSDSTPSSSTSSTSTETQSSATGITDTTGSSSGTDVGSSTASTDSGSLNNDPSTTSDSGTIATGSGATVDSGTLPDSSESSGATAGTSNTTSSSDSNSTSSPSTGDGTVVASNSSTDSNSGPTVSGNTSSSSGSPSDSSGDSGGVSTDSTGTASTGEGTQSSSDPIVSIDPAANSDEEMPGELDEEPDSEEMQCSGSPAVIDGAILLLDPNAFASLNTTGNGIIHANAAVRVNSSHERSAFLTGNSQVITPELGIYGGGKMTPNASIVWNHSSLQFTHRVPLQDPLRNLAAPDKSTLPIRSTSKVQWTQGSHTLEPGVYQGGISLSGKANLTLMPGIYYLKDGGLSVSGQASLTGSQVMIYHDPAQCGDRVQLTGQGKLSLSPPTDGNYRGIVLFQKREVEAEVTMSVGLGDFEVTGMVYAASAPIKISGNGSGKVGSQLIGGSLETRGNGFFQVIRQSELAPQVCP